MCIQSSYTGVYNHTLDRSPRPTLNRIIKALKRMITNEVGFSIWQESFYEEIIRNEKTFHSIWNYIEGNPSQWIADEKI